MDQTVTFQDKLFIGGEWRRGRGADIASHFPADGASNTIIQGASLEDVDLAIERAQDAADDPAWRKLVPHERATHLYRIAEGIAQDADRISHVQSRDTGKTLAETRALALSAAGTFRYMAATLETMEDTLTPSRGNYLTMSVYEPLGVTAAITPWNSPIASDAQKVAPALAAGNAVLLKPSSWSPLVCLELARIIEAAGLPKGLFSTLPGAGSIVGERLVTHPAIRKVSFTGG
ncbi:MAG TPA: aldehyde dehydrogenase family protein, partial [Pseudolabrys sp.]|nr:aldehyde dehydrogenase family protein [Pseudolabrys sp.]